MEQVNVLLSAYNGERYISEQIESILKQENVEVKLYIRDDGSNDNTVNIIKKYEENNSNVKVFSGSNLGYKGSFLSLLSQSIDESGYYAFSDQDDVWLPQKLYQAVNKLEQFEKEKCNLYYSNLVYTDSELNKIGVKQFNDRNITLGSVISHSNIPGCTMVFNNKLAKNLSKIYNNHDNIWGHDNWLIAICLLLNGNLFFDKNSYILFRRHDENVTSLNKSILLKIEEIIKINKKNPRSSSRAAKILLSIFNDDIDSNNKLLLNKISYLYKTNIVKRMYMLTNKLLYTGNLTVDIWIVIKLICKLY